MWGQTAGALRLPALQEAGGQTAGENRRIYFCVMAGALGLPALRVKIGVSIFASWRVRCAYPPYGLKSAYIFVRRVGKRERTHRASELTLR